MAAPLSAAAVVKATIVFLMTTSSFCWSALHQPDSVGPRFPLQRWRKSRVGETLSAAYTSWRHPAIRRGVAAERAYFSHVTRGSAQMAGNRGPGFALNVA